MKFISINGSICLTTHLTVDTDFQTQDTLLASDVSPTISVTGYTVNIEALLFRCGGLPWKNSDGQPTDIEMMMTQGKQYLKIEGGKLISIRPLRHSYENCSAVYVEMIAESVDVVEKTEHINRAITLT